MKIEIEFENSYEAKLTIDGREMMVQTKLGIVYLDGIEQPELEETLGGIISLDLFSRVSNYQQVWASADDEQPNCKTWDKLSEPAAGAASDRLW